MPAFSLTPTRLRGEPIIGGRSEPLLLSNVGLNYTHVQGANFVAKQSVSGANLINA